MSRSPMKGHDFLYVFYGNQLPIYKLHFKGQRLELHVQYVIICTGINLEPSKWI